MPLRSSLLTHLKSQSFPGLTGAAVVGADVEGAAVVGADVVGAAVVGASVDGGLVPEHHPS